MDLRKMRGMNGAVAVTVLATVAIAGCTAGATSAPSANAPTTPTSKVLNVTLDVSSWSDAITPKIPEFEKATGIKVQATALSDDQISNQFNVKLTANSADLDVMMIRPPQDLLLFEKNGWFADLSSNVTANSDWDWNDFAAASRSAVTLDGKVLAVPITNEQQVMLYRKDLLAKAGLQVPKTLDEFRAAMQKIEDQNPGVYGFVGRGQAATAVTQFSSYLYAFGGDFMKDGKSAVDSPEAIQAYEYYGGLLRDFGPPGASNLTWPDAMALFSQGKAAFFTEDDSNGPEALDPVKSAVAKDVGFAQMPAGPAGSHPYNITSFALAVSSFSENKAAAWQFIEWATSKAMVQYMADKTVLGPRTSVPVGSAFPADLAAAIKSSQEVAKDHDRPQVINVGKARDIVGAPIVVAINGGDVKAAAVKASKDFQALIDSEAAK